MANAGGYGVEGGQPLGLPLLTSTNYLGLGQSTLAGTGTIPGLSATTGNSVLQERPVTNLNQETELQKMLINERMRNEMHKKHYDLLKAECINLQEGNRKLQTEVEQAREECRSSEERLRMVIAKSNQELALKSEELAQLRAQSLTPENLELIKLKVAEELEQPFRERFEQLEQEVEHYRGDFNKLRYEHSFLKAEYEHEQAEHKRVVEEVRLQYETEIINLQKDKEAIIAKYSQDNSHDGDKVRVLYRENAQLNLKVKGLLNELDEIRTQREQTGLQSDHVSRLQARQLSEHAANIKALQSEKESLQLHMEQLEKELGASQDSQRGLTTRIHDQERQSAELRNRLEETLHRHKIEVADLRMEATKVKGELERERDCLVNELEGLKSKCEVLQKSLDSQTRSIAEKERELSRKIQAAREEEWDRVNQLEGEKLDLESRLHEFERLKIDEESQRFTEKEAGEGRIKEAERLQNQAERELQLIKAKLEQQTSLGKELEQEQTANSQLREKHGRLKTELQDTHAIEQELMGENDQLKANLDVLQNELALATASIEREAVMGDQRLAQHKNTWVEEKEQLERRLEELVRKLRQAQKQKEDAVNGHVKKKKKYQKVVNKLQDKLQLAEAMNEQLELEKQATKNQIPKETYTKAIRRLRELQKRHNEFRNLLISANVSQVPIGGMSFAAPMTTQPLDASSPLRATQPRRIQTPHVKIQPATTKQDHDTPYHKPVHQQDLSAIRNRLDELSENQRLQMDALLGGGGGLTTAPVTARSEVDGENDDRVLSPISTGMDLHDL